MIKYFRKRTIIFFRIRRKTNEVVVGGIDETFKNSLIATNLNWVSIENWETENLFGKIRASQFQLILNCSTK